MGSKAEKTNQHVRRMAKALKHAKKRNRSEYVQDRILRHMKAIKEGKLPEVHPERVAFRRAAVAAAEKYKAAKAAKETADNRARGRIQVIGSKESEAVAT